MADGAHERGVHPPPHHDTHDRRELSRPSSRNMMISHNLEAALQYDEKARASLDRPGSPSPSSLPLFARQDAPATGVGLPPPPRPKSSSGSIRKTRSPPVSPALPVAGLADGAPPPRASPCPANKHSATASQSNPYINPPPRLAHLMTDDGLVRTHSRTPSLPDRLATRSPESARTWTSGSPQSETHSSPVLVSSPESAEMPPPHSGSSAEGRSAFQRHMRVFSSLPLPRVLGKGKGRASTKSVDETRRASDGGCEAESSGGNPGRDTPQPMMRQFFKSLERHRTTGDESRSAPVSPVVGRNRGALAGETENQPSTQSSDPGFKRRREARQSWSSLAASLAASSESSHEPPPTPDDPRISISSTLYQASHSSIHYSPLYNYNAPLYPPPDMHSDTESFMDLASPTFSPRSPDFPTNTSYPHVADEHLAYPNDTSNAARDTSVHAPRPSLPAITTSVATKPPLPTAPKPAFRRSKSAQPPPGKPSAPGDSPVAQVAAAVAALPPTTNFLNPMERAGRVRTARKLAQLLGHTPPAFESLALSQQAFEANPPGGFLSTSMSNLTGKKKHQRGAVSVSVAPLEHDLPSRAVSGPLDHASLAARRHSSPLSPQTFSFTDAASEEARSSDLDSSSVVIEIGSQQGEPYSDWSSHVDHIGDDDGGGLMSPTSFMDLSEEDVVTDRASSIITVEAPNADRPHLISSGASIYSFTSEEFAEEERRRKREKLAKLHRFLGSRVPVDIVLNQLSVDTTLDLPPVAPTSAVDQPSKMETETRKVWLRRRRSSSAAELGGKWSEEIDRLKEELNDREKALNVRRAIKMEKMFGVQPPQTLYHTRSAPSHAEAQLAAATRQATDSASPLTPTAPHNVNQTAYNRSSKVKKTSHRPGTSESSKPLLDAGNSNVHPFSEIYEHYRHSLNSLNDIMDRDDTASLKRLHSIIHGEADDPTLQHFTREEDEAEEPLNARLERRRSLPSRASMTSISSEFSIAPPTAEELDFTARRKRAAKLTQFFGVNYRDLMSEILDSIEKGLEEERGRGTLRPDEVQELLQKLRKLKIKRNSSFTFTNPS